MQGTEKSEGKRRNERREAGSKVRERNSRKSTKKWTKKQAGLLELEHEGGGGEAERR